MIRNIYSNLPSFKHLDPLKLGLNVLLAQKTQSATSKQTRNRAGKTSLIEIVHFLMGAKINKESVFRVKELADYAFGMTLSLQGEDIKIERSVNNPAKVQIIQNNSLKKEISNEEWTQFLGKRIFGLYPEKMQGENPPSFRSLFSYFVRRQLNEAFIVPEKNANMQQKKDIQMTLLFLLGLDWKIGYDWQKMRDKEKVLSTLKKAMKEGIFGSIVGKSSGLRTQLTVKEAQLKKLQTEVRTFNLHLEYHALEVEANELTEKMNTLANENTLDYASIRDIEKALTSEIPPPAEDLYAVYQEMGVSLPGVVKRRYEDVRSFHESVIRNRKDYLEGELNSAQFRIEKRNMEKIPLDNRRAEIMRILNTHGALEQLTKLQSEIGRLEVEVNIIREQFKTSQKLENIRNELEIERNQLKLRLHRDFNERERQLSEAIMAFEEISQRLYESAGSMTIEETDDGPIFQFPIQGSRSKGIKNMKIFCFDMMLMQLCAKREIGPRFLIHDSHLFDGVDGRQVIRALRIGAEMAKKFKFQYIVTMNEDDAFKEKELDFDLKDYLLPTRLTDATEDGDLFGIRFG